MSNIGMDLKVKAGYGGGAPRGNKAAPRAGAAKGQGDGMGGFNAAAVNKAVSSVKGYNVKPTYSCGAGMGLRNK